MSRRFRWEWQLKSGEKQKDYSAVALLTYTLLLAIVQLRNRRIRKQHIEVKKKFQGRRLMISSRFRLKLTWNLDEEKYQKLTES